MQEGTGVHQGKYDSCREVPIQKQLDSELSKLFRP